MKYLKWLAPLLLAVMLTQIIACDHQTNNTASNAKEASFKPLPDYETARKIFWRKLYTGRVNSFYCGESFNSQQRRGYNVEHVFPMSWATNGLKCGKRKQCRARSRVDVNKERSSYRFGVVNGEKREFGRCDFEVDYRARAAEPAENVRGDVARAMFYMAYQYQEQGLKLFEKQSKLLIQWHKADPPSKEETRRNRVIEGIQGNRNPFIDQPDLLQQLYNKGAFKR